jgi:hypothetical protein
MRRSLAELAKPRAAMAKTTQITVSAEFAACALAAAPIDVLP